MTGIRPTLSVRVDLALKYVSDLDDALTVGVKTKEERAYALDCAEKAQVQLKKAFRDLNRFAMKSIPGQLEG